MNSAYELPVWDLSGLYRGRDDPRIARDLEAAGALLDADTDAGYAQAVTLLARLHAFGSLFDKGRLEAVMHAHVNAVMARSRRRDEPPAAGSPAVEPMLAAISWRGGEIAAAAHRADSGGLKRRWTWGEARALAVAAATSLSPEAGAAAQRVFDEERVHARHPGGALTHPAGVCGPYVRLAFDGSLRAVMTLAHEIGHAAHQMLSRPLGVLRCAPRPALTETAAAVTEMAAFDWLLHEADADERKALLAYRRSDLMAVVVRHAALHRFEAMAQGELSDALWRRAVEQVAGPRAARLERPDGWHAFPILGRARGTAWTYAFARLVAIGLLQARDDDPAAFARRWTAFLAAGGTVDEMTALKPFRIDPTVKAFWTDVMDEAVAQATA